jgi:hypothetical protein
MGLMWIGRVFCYGAAADMLSKLNVSVAWILLMTTTVWLAICGAFSQANGRRSGGGAKI